MTTTIGIELLIVLAITLVVLMIGAGVCDLRDKFKGKGV